FDPLGLAQWRDVDELRENEIANGRGAMLAVVGWVWPQLFGTIPGYPVSSGDPVAAVAEVPSLAWIQIFLFAGVCEAAKENWSKGPKAPVFDPFGNWPWDPAGRERLRLSEIKNGRLAMIAFAGLVVHHYMPGAVP
ncbi:chlorophyll a/b-binding protein domain-containing protein, partial [Pelagophyceae sp. CCMP2097]